MTHALRSENPEAFGWSQTDYLLADIYDAININTRATGHWGRKKPPDIPLYPRPGAESKEKPKATLESVFAALKK